ncbi:hypothetical protein [Lentzea flava]|uniref:DUF4367 domain-containing protein n=1 Tax=Lentzea flava TaxID=103732 RepID=A0ABQ2V0K6_9PSEU|nr:hypothetical protein [Lentzea flava]MCP2202877.1 hypothetical protein [Lentzea flava]GGU62823.1 hypothetical protein GCM10010178_63640 [Lentzea flava]
MNDTEQLVKDALGKLAERTPHPGPTLNALRRKRKRPRNVFLISVAGMAAVAVLIFAGVIASDRYTPPSGNDAAAALIPGNGQSVALKYAPHWLPTGYVENFRLVDREVHRVWVPEGAKGFPFTDGGPQIALIAGGDQPEGVDWQDTTVRGLKAKIALRDQTAELVWHAQDLLKVSVRGFPDARQVALQVAESVRADSKVVHRAAFKLDGRYADHTWGSKPADWEAMSIWKNQVSVHVGTLPPQLVGDTKPVVVRGREGLRTEKGVAVFDGSVWIWATAESNTDLVVEAVNKVELVPSPDTSWIGKGL